MGAGALPCPPEHLDRVEVASALTEGVRPPEGSRMRGVIPSPDGLRSACSTLGQVGGPRVWPDTRKSQEAGPWDGVWNTRAKAAAAGSSLGVGGGQRPREAAEM